MKHATGLDLNSETSPYWADRERFDSGKLSPEEYWSGVLGCQVSAQKVDLLETLDAAQWSHLNPTTLSVLESLQGAHANMALLSNMPAQMSERFLTGSSWTSYFSKLYFSGQLGLVKPDRRIFDHVVVDLDALPQDIVFIDDNAANIAAAKSLGFKAILHTPAIDLRKELAKVHC